MTAVNPVVPIGPRPLGTGPEKMIRVWSGAGVGKPLERWIARAVSVLDSGALVALDVYPYLGDPNTRHAKMLIWPVPGGVATVDDYHGGWVG